MLISIETNLEPTEFLTYLFITYGNKDITKYKMILFVMCLLHDLI